MEGYRLSPQQKRLYLLQEGGTPYLAQVAILIEGDLILEALALALNQQLTRNHILRTSFQKTPEMDLPIQVVVDGALPAWRHEDLSGKPEADQEIYVEDLFEKERHLLHDFERGATSSIYLLKLSSDRHLLVLNMCSLCADVWSLKALVHRISEAYGAHLEDRELEDETLQYIQYSEWQSSLLESDDERAGKEFWSKHPFWTVPALVLSGGGEPAEDQLFLPDVIAVTFGDDLSTGLRETAEKYDLSFKAILLACWQTLLWRFTDQSEIAVGALFDGRKYKETEHLLGLTARYLPVVAQIERQEEAVELIRRLDNIVEETGEWEETFILGQSPEVENDDSLLFFPVGFEYLDLTGKQQAGSVNFSIYRQSSCIDRFNLRLVCSSRNNSFSAEFHYDPAVIDSGIVQSLAASFEAILRNIIEEPRTPVDRLRLVCEAEWRRFADEVNSHSIHYDLGQSVQEIFEEQAAQTPDAIAIVCGERCLTYGELDAGSNRLARRLQALNVKPETRVAICVERSPELIISLLGVLKAGGAYVPLDPSYPPSRLAYMLEDSEAAILLTQTKLSERFPDCKARTLYIDSNCPVFAQERDDRVTSELTPDNPAYVIYTSGSTGMPKGAVITHKGLLNYLRWCVAEYEVGLGGSTLVHSSIAFDFTITTIFGPLIAGQKLLLTPQSSAIEGLIEVLRSEKHLSLLKLTPGHLRLLSQELSSDELASLTKSLVIGGEALMVEDVSAWQQASPQTRMFNEYGPTETVVGCSIFQVQYDRRGRGAVPIGRPIANTQLYLLDAYLQPVPVGVPGEIYIGGAGLARGYFNRPDLTAQQFVPNLFVQNPNDRLYKTGDLGRYLANGNIEFIGRIDEQVKIRGYRVEPGEIEGVIKSHPAIADCVAVVKTIHGGGRQIIAYYVKRDGEGVNEEELRRYAEDRLPEYMWVGRYEELAEMPLNENGKVDRKRLKERESEREGGKTEIGRRDEEEILQGIWKQVLGVKQVGVNDRYFALGGDSIRSIQIIAGAREKGLNFSIEDLFEHQTISDIVKALRERQRSSNDLVRTELFSLITEEDRKKLPADVEDAYPLTMLQAGMIYHMQMSPHSSIYHDVFSFHLKARLDAKKLERAVREVVRMHPVLRTTFDLVNYSEAMQLIHKEAEAEIRVADLSGMTEAEQEEEISRWVEREKGREFDIEKGPLLRIHLHIRAEDRFQFTLSFHHAILDGWSDATLTTELFRHYLHALEGSPFEIQPPAASFRDYVALEREAIKSKECQQYWSEKLKANTFLELPRLRRPDHRSERHRLMVVREVPISERLSEDLKALALANAVPLKSVLLAAHLKEMSVIGGQSDVLTSMVSAGRPEHADGERVLGLHINSLPVRLKLNGGTWQDLIKATFETEREALSFRRYPMAELKKKNGGRPLSETIFYFTHYHIYQSLQELTEVHVLDRIFYEETSFALVAYFRLDPFTSRVHLDLTCDASELTSNQIESIGEYYLKALEAMTRDPYARYDTVSLLSESEMQRLLVEWNSAKTEVEDRRCLHEIFEEQARAGGDRIALVCGDAQISYGELDRRANRLAGRLRRMGVRAEKIVGVLMSRREEVAVAILGILKSGGAYLPVDEQTPQARLELMLKEAGVEVVVTEEKLKEKVRAAGVKVIEIEREEEEDGAEGNEAVEGGAGGGNAAYVIYTSGTTGKPKGAVVTHANVIGLFEGTEEKFNFNERDVWSLFHSTAFDFSVWEMWGALLKGGRLVIVPYWVSRDPEAFYQLLQREEVTVLNQTPSAFMQLIERDGEEERDGSLKLRIVILGGEAVEAGRLRRWKRKHGVEKPELVNMYGITETTVHVTYYRENEQEAENHWSVIGRAIEGNEVLILDERQALLPVGVIGEIFVAGRGLSRGYIGDPGKTAEAYPPNPYGEAGGRMYRSGDLGRYREDGDIEYAGRKDRQVKVRGFRIELPEIEYHLMNHPGVQKAAVVVDESDIHEKRLRAFILPDEVSASPIRQLLHIERQGALNRHNRFDLPNGLIIAHKNRSETEFMFKEIFDENVYLKHGIALHEGDVVFDVGANIGLFTLFANEHCGQLRTYAFEPIPQLFDLLRLNASIHGLNVNLFDCGLSGEAAEAAFTYYPNISVLSGRFANTEQERDTVRKFIQNERQASANGAEALDEAIVEEMLAERLSGEPITCRLKTLSQVIQEQEIERIDLLKIDVEKSELDVLSGITENDWPKIRQIVVEVHDLDGRLNRVLALLEKHGYKFMLEQDRLLKDTGLYNVYAVQTHEEGRPANSPNGGAAKHSYTWRNPNQLVGALRDFLKGNLPGYMVPSSFVLVDEMPLTSNGKIDYKALPITDTVNVATNESLAPSSNWVEFELAQIWRAVLRTQAIGIHENFFELGGDSILSVQIIAKAKRKGIHLTPKQLFQYPTIAELASVATTSRVEAEQGIVTGALPLTPIQRWFFEQETDHPSHFNQAVFLEVERSVDASLLEPIWNRLIAHHDALRLQFRKVESRWEQYNAPMQPSSSFMMVDLSNHSDEEKRSALEQAATSAQASLDISQGLLAQAIYFDLGPNMPGRLLILVHHLAIDGVSWRILLEDLQTACEQLNRGDSINLPMKSSPFKEWAYRLQDQAQRENTKQEFSYWKSLFQKPLSPIPLNYSLGDNSQESIRTFELGLDEGETLALLQRVPQALQAPINVALIAALTEAFLEWTGERRLFIDIEGHGREEIIEGIDLSRTVGWFTTIFPAVFELEAGAQGLNALQAVNEHLRHIPNKGIGYGLLRYLCEDQEIAAALRAMPRAEVVFNYMGQLDMVLAESSPFKLAQESTGPARSSSSSRSYLIEINARVIHGRLQFEWAYSESRHKRDTIENLARAVMDKLRLLIAQADSARARNQSLTKHPQSPLRQEKLNKLLAQYQDVQDYYRLSPAQQGMVFHTLYAPKSGVYSVIISCILEGDLNVPAFKRAWERVVDQHPILRTSFVWEGVDEPIQIVRAGARPEFSFYDRRGISSTERRNQLETLIKAEREEGFNLSTSPLMRFTIIELEENVHQFVWSFHHAVLDGWSGPILLKQVLAFYQAFCTGRELDLEPRRPYREYIDWLEKQDRSAAERFWKQALDQFTGPTRLRLGRTTAKPSESNHSYEEAQEHLSAQTTSALRRLARKGHVTLNTMVQAAWALALSHFSGDTDLVFGATVSGRPPELIGSDSMVGVFINTLPVRVKISEDLDLFSWLRQLQESQAEMRQYEYSSLVDIQRWSGMRQDLPLFDYILVFENYPAEISLNELSGPLRIHDLRFIDASHYPLTITAALEPTLLLRFNYDRRYFDSYAIARMLAAMSTGLQAFVENPEVRLQTIIHKVAEADRQYQGREADRLEGFNLDQLNAIKSTSSRRPR